jgi:hypothetical protein
MATIAQYIPYSEVNNGKASTVNEFESEISKYSARRLLHVCSAMNALIRSEEATINRAAHDSLVNTLFERDLARRLLNREGDVKFAFHRQQILFVAKTATRVSQLEDAPLSQAERLNLGRVFLMASDHLPQLEHKPDDFANLDDKFAFYAAQFLPIQEASGYHGFAHKMARSYLMLTKSAPQLARSTRYKDFAADFEHVTKLPLLTFQALLFGSIAKVREFDPNRYNEDPFAYGLDSQWFRTTKIPKEKVDVFFDLVSASVEEYRKAYEKRNEGPSDFTPFRNKPLFRDNEKVFLVDFAFLAEKFETAPFWILHNSLRTDKEKDDLHAFWGEVFEQYGGDIFGAANPAINAIHNSPKFKDPKKGQVCDLVVKSGRSAAFIEFKGATFTAQSKYCGDFNRLKQAIKEKLVEDDAGAKAVQQLARSISLACDGKAPEEIDGLSVADLSWVYPVVVTRDDIGSTVGVNAFLQHRFDGCFNHATVKQRVTPLFCLGAEDLERLIPYLTDTAFTELLYAHYRANKKVSPAGYIMQPYFATKENAILLEKGYRRTEFHSESLNEITIATARHLGLEIPQDRENL